MRKLLILFLLLIPLISKADIKTFLDNAVIEIENPTSIQTDTHHVYFGGGVHVRTPRVTFQPFQVVAPSIKVGCGGIDITFGAFSYFKPEYLVNFVKKTVAEAPAIAFWTAIQTLCPQCQQLQAKLAQLANAINSINFDSCQTTQAIGGKVGEWVGSSLNDALGVGTEGPDWLAGINNAIGDTTKFINDTFNNTMSSKGCNPTERGCYLHFMRSTTTSLLEYILEDNSYFSSDTGFQNILRTVVGDVKKLGTSGEQQLKYKYIPPTVTGATTDMIIYGLTGINSNCGNWTYQFALDKDGKTVSASTKTVCYYVRDKLSSIISKIENRQSLTSSELQFLNMFKIPVYKLLNTLSLQPNILSSLQRELEVLLSYELVYEILSAINSDYNHIAKKLLNASVDGYLPINPEYFQMIEKNQRALLRKAHTLATKSQREFSEKVRNNLYIEQLRASLMASLARHPMMDSRLYAQSLLGFGF